MPDPRDIIEHRVDVSLGMPSFFPRNIFSLTTGGGDIPPKLNPIVLCRTASKALFISISLHLALTPEHRQSFLVVRVCFSFHLLDRFSFSAVSRALAGLVTDLDDCVTDLITVFLVVVVLLQSP
jgi:hypothetical protein